MLNSEDSEVYLDWLLMWSLFALLAGLTTCGSALVFYNIANIQGITISNILPMELLL